MNEPTAAERFVLTVSGRGYTMQREFAAGQTPTFAPVDGEDSRFKWKIRTSMPVAGTPIVHNSLYGQWTATAYLDDDVEPCSPTKAFLITD